MKRNLFISAALIMFVSIMFVTGCKSNSTNYNSTPTTPSNSGANEVLMQSSMFNPSSITVSAGTKITWTNKDGYDHTVTSGTPAQTTGLFDSGNISAGGTFSFTFNTKGTYQYFCRIHSSMMQGTVTVQ